MPRWLIVLLIVGASGALLVGLAIGGFVWWFKAHRGELIEKGAAAQAEGKEYGVSKGGAHACIDESLTRLEHTTGIAEHALVRIFLKSCLQSAPPDGALCVGVPAAGDIFQSAVWRINTCAAHGKRGDQECAQLLGALQDVCHPKP